jgi:lysophospholipase L1-like esterase
MKSYSFVRPPGDARSAADAYGDQEWAVAYFQELAALPGFRWHPYVYWRRAPFEGRFINIDEDGLRKTWQAANDAETRSQRFRVFMLGGSTMWGTGAEDDQTIPSIVARALTEEYRQNVEVTNFGASAYVSTQEVITLLRELQKGNIPDLVIFYDGVNDAFGAFQHKGVGGLPNNESNRVREFNLLRPGNLGRLYKEALVVTFESSSTYQVIRALARRATGHDLFKVELDRVGSPPPDHIAREVARTYAWNVKLVKNLGPIYGFKTLFYWQPNVFTKAHLTPYEKQIREGGRELGPYYAQARDAVAALLADVEVFHDISDVFREDRRPYFIDDVHLSQAGNAVVARRMLNDIAPIAGERHRGYETR